VEKELVMAALGFAPSVSKNIFWEDITKKRPMNNHYPKSLRELASDNNNGNNSSLPFGRTVLMSAIWTMCSSSSYKKIFL
jgi:hypothetical protein